MSAASPPAPTPPRRCRSRPVPLRPGALRPSDMLAAFFLTGIAFLLAGAVVRALDATGQAGWWAHWLSLHLALLGGVSLLVLGAGQFFTTAFLATDPPGRRMIAAQLVVWSAGTILVAVGVPARSPALTDLGGALVVVGLLLFATALRQLERRSLQRARWAVRWYYACAAALALGAVLGILMARGTGWTHGSLLGAHLVLNLAGWFGTAIVGTLHTFHPSLTHTQLARPRLQGPTFAAWTTGVVALAAGQAFDAGALGVAGWCGLGAASVLLLVNVAAGVGAAQGPIGLPARLVSAAQVFLPAALVVALVAVAIDGPDAPLDPTWRPALAVLALAGWIGMTVGGSLLHLLTVLLRVRGFRRAMPAPRPRRDRAVVAAAVVAVALLALGRAAGLEDLRGLATIALLLVVARVGGEVLLLAGRATAPALRARTSR